MPKVSVIVPVYNVEKYLKECLDSIINQTLQDIEIICIDDGSTDSSLNILNEYANIDSRIKVLTQTNKGAGAARNKGLGFSSGEYLYFLDSDDYLESSILEKLYLKSVAEDADICICKRKHLNKNNGEIQINHSSLYLSMLPNKVRFSGKDISNNIFQFCTIGVFTKLYKASFIKANNLKFQEIKVVNDVFFNHATLALANSITYINEPLMVYRVDRQGCLTGQRGKSLDCLICAYSKLIDLLKEKGLFSIYEDSMYRRAITSMKYEISLCSDKSLRKNLQKQFKEFIPKIYWDKYVKTKRKTKREILKTVFSITNQGNHKVFTLLGVKLKIKRKLKNTVYKHVNFNKFPDLSYLIRQNINKLPDDIDLIVGVPRSGIIPAYMIALFLNKNVCSLPEFLSNMIPGKGQRLMNTKNLQPKNILIVDDSIMSGKALAKVKASLSTIDLSSYNIRFLAIYATEQSCTKVDYYFKIVPAPRLFQWNYLNHIFANSSCYDMDGVLCVDPTNEQNDDGEKYIDFITNAKPLYIPAYKIHSIVTSRLEKYRPQTEAWLKKHNVKYDNLYMLNATAEERRTKKLHASFKAEIYNKQKDCFLFIESNPKQAKEIYELTGKSVICVETDEFYESKQ